MRRIVRMTALLLCIAALLTVSAAADLKKGDTGEEVRALQQKLWESGFLFEEPDGRFGYNTEEAVKWFQQGRGLEATGVVTDDLATLIDEVWCECAIDINGEDYFAENGESGASKGISDRCEQRTMPDGSCETDYCARHGEMRQLAEDLICEGDAASAMSACEIWQVEIDMLYDRWAQLVPEDSREAVFAARAVFFSAMRTQSVAAEVSGASELRRATAMECWLRNQTAWLCETTDQLSEVNTNNRKGE